MINVTTLLIALLIIALLVSIVLSMLKKATRATIYLAILALLIIGGVQLAKALL